MGEEGAKVDDRDADNVQGGELRREGEGGKLLQQGLFGLVEVHGGPHYALGEGRPGSVDEREQGEECRTLNEMIRGGCSSNDLLYDLEGQ